MRGEGSRGSVEVDEARRQDQGPQIFGDGGFESLHLAQCKEFSLCLLPSSVKSSSSSRHTLLYCKSDAVVSWCLNGVAFYMILGTHSPVVRTFSLTRGP